MSSLPDKGVGRQFPDAPTQPIAPAVPAAPTIIRHPSAPFPDLIDHILPSESLCLLSGGSGVGKTAFIAEWCARFRDQRTICYHPTRTPPGGIGIIVGDRKWTSHRQWFEAAGYPDISHYSLIDDHGFNWDRLLNRVQLPQLFESAIRNLELKPGGLVIIDPISLYVDGNLIDFKKTAVALVQLQKVCTRCQVTVIGIVHVSKQKSDKKDHYVRPQDRVLGSAAFSAFTDTSMYLLGAEELDAEYHKFGWIPHHAPGAEFSFIRNPDTGLFIPYEHPNREADMLHILSTVTEHPSGMRAKEILDANMAQLGLAKSTVYTYMNTLLLKGQIEKVGRGFWRRSGPPLQQPIPPTPDTPPEAP